MDDYPTLVFHAHSKKTKKRLYRWRFSLKDVMILLAIASAMSGLMGLGCMMVIDFIEALLQRH
jgi:hypothetical protein